MLKELKKAKVGDFYGTEMTAMDSGYSETKNDRIQNNLSEGIIGNVISVLPPNVDSPINAVLEDFDFEDRANKRYIFSYYNEETKADETIDTLFDKGWTIVDSTV